MEFASTISDRLEPPLLNHSENVVTAVGSCDTETATVGVILEELVSRVTEDIEVTEGIEVTLPTKKLKENGEEEEDGDENSMEVDNDGSSFLSLENKENILQGLKKMSRKELEDVVLVKIVEALLKQSEVGKFRTKMLEMQLNKEKMQQRVTHLQKQVVEMGKAVKLLLDNHNRDPNNLNPNKKRPPPIKFYRSVGLQVTIEPSVRNGTSKVIHVNNVNGVPLNGVKPLNNNNNHHQSSFPTKRPGPKSLTDPRVMKPTNNNSNNNNNNNNQKQGLLNGHLSPTKIATNISNTVHAISNNKQSLVSAPTVVDLTDDAVVVGSTETSSNGNVYRIVNASPGGSYHLLTSNGQNRSILLTQNVSGVGTSTTSSGRPISAVVVRNMTPISTIPNKPPMQQQQMNQQNQPRAPPGLPSYNRPTTVVTTIPNRPVSSAVPAAVIKQHQPLLPQQQQPQVGHVPTTSRKIQLPPLPSSAVVPIPRGRILKDLPPKPTLTLTEQTDGIVLSWSMKLSSQNEEVASYQIYACQESLATSPGKTSSWKKVGDVKALPLPMACTLSQFTQGNRYFFIVRANDVHGRSGPFCEPGPIVLQKK